MGVVTGVIPKVISEPTQLMAKCPEMLLRERVERVVRVQLVLVVVLVVLLMLMLLMVIGGRQDCQKMQSGGEGGVGGDDGEAKQKSPDKSPIREKRRQRSKQ